MPALTLLDGYISGATPLAVALLLGALRGHRFGIEWTLYAAVAVFALAVPVLWRSHRRARPVGAAQA